MLFLQVLSAFLAGGGIITLLSLLAEKADTKVAGIIMMFPTTIVLGFFFLGFATSAEAVANVVPATLIPLGIVVFSSVIYIKMAQLFSKTRMSKMQQLTATLFSSSIIWFTMAAPFAYWKFSNVILGVIGYILFARVAHILLNKQNYTIPVPVASYNRIQILVRALFIGSILSVVVILGNKLNPFWGGIFTMYPAATFASLVLFHYYYEPGQLTYFMRKAPTGSISLFLYAMLVMLLFPLIGVIPGTILCYLVSMLFSLALIKMQHKMT